MNIFERRKIHDAVNDPRFAGLPAIQLARTLGVPVQVIIEIRRDHRQRLRQLDSDDV